MAERDPIPRYVLVVEDEPILRMNAVELLEDAGFEVLDAGDADAALELLEQVAGQVGAVFTDVNMPGSLDGMDFVREVHSRWPHIRPVVTSGRARIRNDDIPDHGCFVSKPYRLTDLTEALRPAFRS